MRKARALQAQRREEYQRARSSTIRSQEEQQQQTQPPATAAGSKQLEKKRKIEEEALQKVLGATVQALQYNIQRIVLVDAFFFCCYFLPGL